MPDDVVVDPVAAAADTLEAADTSATETETEPPAPSPGAEPAAETPEQAEEKELAALEAELVSKDERLKKGYIATGRHQAVLTRARNQLAAQIEQTKKEYEERLAKFKDYEGEEFSERYAAIQLAERDPETFVTQVLANDPRYVQTIEKWIASRQPAKPEEPPDLSPDIFDANSNPVYSAARVDAIIAAREAALEKKLEAKYGKVLERTEAQERWEKSVSHVRKELEAASKWEGFQENREEITKWHAANKGASLHDAYRAVVVPKFKADREALTKEIEAAIIKKMNDAAKNGPPRRIETSGESASKTGPRSTRDIVAAAADRLEA